MRVALSNESVGVTNVKSPVKRPYDSSGRQARTRRTRAAVVEAARTLFLTRSYAATTMEAISETAETPGVLAALLDTQRILLGAADADPAAAALLAEHTRQRRDGQARIAHALAAAGALRTDLTEIDAADIVYTLMSPEVYRLLTDDRGWSPERYERWLADALITQLLPGAEVDAAKERNQENRD